MCRVLGVSRSSYYAWLNRPVSHHAQEDVTLGEWIRTIYHESGARYGSPRIHNELQVQGVCCGKKRVARLMREQQLSAHMPPRFVATTDSAHLLPTAPNSLNRQYQVEALEGINRVWAGDITYIPTAQGWLYLAVVLDLKSRRVIGWGMSHSLEQQVVHDALEMALGQRQPEEAGSGMLFHSDRGSQYAAAAYQEKLAQQGIACSMSRRGNCWDDAPVESFFATLKKELVHREKYQTREQAKASVFSYIEVFYLRRRRHSALGYLSPHDYEQTLLN
jgi:transposase InsO family protein